MQEHQEVVLGLFVGRRRARSARATLDLARRDVLEARSAEPGSRRELMRRAVVAQGRGLAAAVVLGVAQVFGGGVGERRAVARAGEGPAAGTVEHVGSHCSASAVGVVARRRAARSRSGADPASAPGARREPVLRVPDAATLALDSKDVAGRALGLRGSRRRSPAQLYLILATFLRPIRECCQVHLQGSSCADVRSDTFRFAQFATFFGT